MDSKAKALLNAKRDRERRDMLYVLKGDYGKFVNVRVIGDVMKSFNHALTDRAVRFHLTYLEQKGFVELMRIDVPETRECNVVDGAKLLARGIDLIDGRTGIGVAEL